MSLINKILICYIIFFSTQIIIFAQNSNQPIILNYSDSLVRSNLSGQNIREFIGRVSFTQGNVNLFCDKAIQNIDLNQITLIGNVKITQDEMVLTSPRIIYYGKEGLAESFTSLKIKDKYATLTALKGTYNTNNFTANFIGNVEIKDDTVNIKSDKISYNRKTRISEAEGNVRIEDDSMLVFADYIIYERNKKDSKAYKNVYVKHKKRNFFLTCDTLINLNSEKYSISLGKPICFFIDTLRNSKVIDTSSIKADKIESLTPKDNEKFIFTNNVELIKSNFSSKCNFMQYFRNVELLELRENPILWIDSTQLTADSITIYLNNNKIKRIFASRNSFLASNDDTLDLDLINQISGRSMEIIFSNDSIISIFSEGDSKSLYFIRNDDNSLAASRNASNNILIKFEENKPINIDWIGTVKGEYFPENLFTGGVEQFYLPNFTLRKDKPQKNILIIKE